MTATHLPRIRSRRRFGSQAAGHLFQVGIPSSNAQIPFQAPKALERIPFGGLRVFIHQRESVQALLSGPEMFSIYLFVLCSLGHWLTSPLFDSIWGQESHPCRPKKSLEVPSLALAGSRVPSTGPTRLLHVAVGPLLRHLLPLLPEPHLATGAAPIPPPQGFVRFFSRSLDQPTRSLGFVGTSQTTYVPS